MELISLGIGIGIVASLIVFAIFDVWDTDDDQVEPVSYPRQREEPPKYDPYD